MRKLVMAAAAASVLVGGPAWAVIPVTDTTPNAPSVLPKGFERFKAGRATKTTPERENAPASMVKVRKG